MTYVFTSPLAGDIAAFIAFKQVAGSAYTSGQYVLARLDAYATRCGATALTRETVAGFIDDYGHGKAARPYVCYLRGFARFLQSRGQDAYVAAPQFTPTDPRPATFLLLNRQLEAFFQAAAGIERADPWGWQAKAFYGLMLACGLRTCEARRLDRADIHLNSGYIDILWSKGPRSRRLPITSCSFFCSSLPMPICSTLKFINSIPKSLIVSIIRSEISFDIRSRCEFASKTENL